MLSIWEARSFFKYSEHVEANTINKEHELPVSLAIIGIITILNAIALHFLVCSLANILFKITPNFLHVPLFIQNLIKLHKIAGTSDI